MPPTNSPPKTPPLTETKTKKKPKILPSRRPFFVRFVFLFLPVCMAPPHLLFAFASFANNTTSGAVFDAFCGAKSVVLNLVFLTQTQTHDPAFVSCFCDKRLVWCL